MIQNIIDIHCTRTLLIKSQHCAITPTSFATGLNEDKIADEITEMNQFNGLFYMVLLSAKASSSKLSTFQRTRAGTDDTDVVSLAFCESSLPAEDKKGK